ncbi:MAG: AEC family transporter [Xanthomonadaceae bacterium]|nr:AEC family transporter [Xanthomonadaceae bacterium]
MNLFSELLLKVSPLFFFLIIGFIAGRVSKVHKEGLAKLLIYYLSPALIFTQMLRAHLTISDLWLPGLIWALGSVIAVGYYFIGSRVYPEGTKKNLLGFAAGNANSGYFGIPVADALFGGDAVARVILCGMGYILYENSVGFYLAARGHSSISSAVMKVVKLPGFHAAWLGISLNLLFGATENSWVQGVNQNLRGAYSILGVALVGLAMSELARFKFDLKFNALSFSAKYLAWPLALYALVYGNESVVQIFDAENARVLKLIAWVPLAANTVAIAAELKTEPETASMAVFLSTIFSLFLIPFVMMVAS